MIKLAKFHINFRILLYALGSAMVEGNVLRNVRILLENDNNAFEMDLILDLRRSLEEWTK